MQLIDECYTTYTGGITMIRRTNNRSVGQADGWAGLRDGGLVCSLK